MTFSPETTVGQVASEFPATIRVFQRHGVKFCCGGHRTLREACRDGHLSYADLAAELFAAVTAAGAATGWMHRPATELIAHLIESFHDPLRQELPRLCALAADLQGHGDEHRRVLAVIEYVLTRFTADTRAQMDAEEHELFPLIERIALARPSEGDAARLEQLLSQSDAAHQDARQTLRILRQITDGYHPPATACPALRTLYERLRELEAHMQLHVHLERNELLMRATARPSEAGVERY